MRKSISVSPYVFPGLINKQELKEKCLYKRDRVSAEMIAKVISEKCGVTRNDIFSRVRKTEVIDARFIFQFILKNEFRYTYQSIGGILGRDHTTVIHAVNTHKSRYEQYDNYRKLTDVIHEDIKKLIHENADSTPN